MAFSASLQMSSGHEGKFKLVVGVAVFAIDKASITN